MVNWSTYLAVLVVWMSFQQVTLAEIEATFRYDREGREYVLSKPIQLEENVNILDVFSEKCQDLGGYLAEVNDYAEYKRLVLYVFSDIVDEIVAIIGTTRRNSTEDWVHLTTGLKAYTNKIVDVKTPDSREGNCLHWEWFGKRETEAAWKPGRCENITSRYLCEIPYANTTPTITAVSQPPNLTTLTCTGGAYLVSDMEFSKTTPDGQTVSLSWEKVAGCKATYIIVDEVTRSNHGEYRCRSAKVTTAIREYYRPFRRERLSFKGSQVSLFSPGITGSSSTKVTSQSLDDLNAMMNLMNATIRDLNKTIQTKAAALQDLSAQVSDLNTKDAAKTQQIVELNTLVGRTKHVESGLVDCNGDSDTWPNRDRNYEWMTTTISFSTPYDTPPVVHLGGLTEWINFGQVRTDYDPPAYTNYFSVTLTSVTNTNFTVRCEGWEHWGDNTYWSYKMSANWISLYDTSKL